MSTIKFPPTDDEISRAIARLELIDATAAADLLATTTHNAPHLQRVALRANPRDGSVWISDDGRSCSEDEYFREHGPCSILTLHIQSGYSCDDCEEDGDCENAAAGDSLIKAVEQAIADRIEELRSA